MELTFKHKIYSSIIDEQFKIIGENIKFKDIPEDGNIEVKKKKMLWYEFYLFSNKEQYLKWKDWAQKELNKVGREKDFDKMDMLYGLNYRYENGLLF